MFLHDSEAEAELGRYLVSSHPARAEPRKAVSIDGIVILLRKEMACTVLDLTRLGARLAMADVSHLSIGDEVMLTIPAYGEVAATVRRVSKEHVVLIFRKALIGDLPG